MTSRPRPQNDDDDDDELILYKGFDYCFIDLCRNWSEV